MLKTSLLLLAALATTTVHAQRTNRLGGDPVLFEDDASYWSLDETFAPVVTSANDTSQSPNYPGTAPVNGFGLDARTSLLWAYEAQWLVGTTFNFYQLKGTRNLVSWGQDAMTQLTSRYEWGPTVGWTSSGWRLLVTWFLAGQQRVATRTNNHSSPTSDITIKNKNLDGFQVSLGYTFHLFGRVYLGPTLVYRAIKWHVQSRANAYSTADSYGSKPLYRAGIDNALVPMLMLDVRF